MTLKEVQLVQMISVSQSALPTPMVSDVHPVLQLYAPPDFLLFFFLSSIAAVPFNMTGAKPR